MNKSELISKMADDAGISKAQAQSALNSMISGVGGAMKKGDKVTLEDVKKSVDMKKAKESVDTDKLKNSLFN